MNSWTRNMGTNIHMVLYLSISFYQIQAKFMCTMNVTMNEVTLNKVVGYFVNKNEYYKTSRNIQLSQDIISNTNLNQIE